MSPQTDPETVEDDTAWQLVRSPPPLIISSTGALSTFDMQMMHQWSSTTSKQIAIGEGGNNTLQFVIPSLAFENEFLMQGMLGIASLHTQTMVPDPTALRKQTDLYRAKALSGFRKTLQTLQPFSRTYEAATVMSILLVILCARDQALEEGELTVVNWFILYRGLSTVMTMATFPKVKSMSVGPLFTRELGQLTTIPVVPTVLMDMVRSIPVDDPDYEMLEDYCLILDSIGMLYASLQEEGADDGLWIRITAWPSFSSHGFSRCASEYRPRALVILSYYLCFVKLCTLWWTEEVADKDIMGIAKAVGPKWLPFMIVPLQVAVMTDKVEIAKLMFA